MKRLRIKSTALGLMLATSTVSTSAMAQSASIVTRQPASVKLNPDQVRVIKRSPLTFQAFEVRDPQTGKAISPDTTLTLPDGKQVKAGEYYAELNRLEREFSSLGYSLREDQDRIKLQESVNDISILQRQREEISQQHRRVNFDAGSELKTLIQRNQLNPDTLRTLQQRLSPDVLQPDVLQPDVLRPGNLKQLRVQDFKKLPIDPIRFPIAELLPTKSWSRSWSQSVGNSGTFSAYLNGKIDLTGSNTFAKAYAEGNAGGYIFNNHANLLRVTGDVNSKANSPSTPGKASANFKVAVLGQNVYNFSDQKNQSSWNYSNSWSTGIGSPIATVYFPLGPIPIRATFGVQGEAGFQYNVAAGYSTQSGTPYALASIQPFVRSRAYGEGGADVVVAGAGVGVNLTLLNDTLNAYGYAYFARNSANKPYLQVIAGANNSIEALNGNVYAYAYVYVPKFGIPPWKKKQWDWNIWDWDGLKYSGNLFQTSSTIYW